MLLGSATTQDLGVVARTVWVSVLIGFHVTNVVVQVRYCV